MMVSPDTVDSELWNVMWWWLEDKEGVCDRVGEEGGLEDGFEAETGEDSRCDEDVWSFLSRR